MCALARNDRFEAPSLVLSLRTSDRGHWCGNPFYIISFIWRGDGMGGEIEGVFTFAVVAAVSFCIQSFSSVNTVI